MMTENISPGKIVSFIDLLGTDHVTIPDSDRIFMKFRTKLKGHFKMLISLSL